MSEKYIIKSTPWSEISNEERENAILVDKVFICKMTGLNYPTLEFGIYNPNINDIICLIAVFNKIEDAICFINARF